MEIFRLGEGTRWAGCVPTRNHITFVAAIVAPQTCDLVRGVPVLIASVRPADSTVLLCCPRSPALAFAEVFFLVLFDSRESGRRPIAESRTSNVLGDGCRNYARPNPSAEGTSMNSQYPRRIGDRVLLIVHKTYAPCWSLSQGRNRAALAGPGQLRRPPSRKASREHFSRR
jgi:hypothetical protein